MQWWGTSRLSGGRSKRGNGDLKMQQRIIGRSTNARSPLGWTLACSYVDGSLAPVGYFCCAYQGCWYFQFVFKELLESMLILLGTLQTHYVELCPFSSCEFCNYILNYIHVNSAAIFWTKQNSTRRKSQDMRCQIWMMLHFTCVLTSSGFHTFFLSNV